MLDSQNSDNQVNLSILSIIEKNLKKESCNHL
jgi:hypothetical protein